jgi:anti-anti-sigma factor
MCSTTSVAARSDSVVVEYCDGVSVLELPGEHDLTTANDVASNIAVQIVRNRGIVVSLSETAGVDSSVVRVFLRADEELVRHGRRLVLHMGDNESVRRVLELAGVSDRFVCCDALDEAVELAAQLHRS